jgi:hypothetical protein
VEADARDDGAGQVPIKELADRLGMHRATGRAREDRVTEPDGAAIASLLPKPATEDLLRLWIQIDAAAAGACLDGDLD